MSVTAAGALIEKRAALVGEQPTRPVVEEPDAAAPLQNFLILVCLLVSYPIMPTLAWQERDKHPTLAIIVIALWVFVVPVFVIGFSSTLWAGASRIITAPFSAGFSYEPSSEVFQQTRLRLRYAPRWDI